MRPGSRCAIWYLGVADRQAGEAGGFSLNGSTGDGVGAPLVAELMHAVDDVDILGLGERDG